MATTQLGNYGNYTGSVSPGYDVRDLLGDFVADYDVPGIIDAYRAAINAQLDGTGISLHGCEFYGVYPARPDATDLIQAAVAAVDLGALAARYDTKNA